jgi:hypothetical protein
MGIADQLDDIKQKAKKLKALADKGVGGEKNNAKKMLDDYLKKHNLKLDDIDDSRFMRNIKVPNMHEARQMLIECVLSLVPDAKFQEDLTKKIVRVRLNDIDYLEVLDKFQYFWTAFQKDRQLLLISYFNRYKKFFIRELNIKFNPRANDNRTQAEILREMKAREMEQERMAQMDDEDSFFSFGGKSNPDHQRAENYIKTDKARIIKMMDSLADLYYVRSSKTIKNH